MPNLPAQQPHGPSPFFLHQSGASNMRHHLPSHHTASTMDRLPHPPGHHYGKNLFDTAHHGGNVPLFSKIRMEKSKFIKTFNQPVAK